MAGKSKPNELELHRIFNAPVKAVWEAWTDPDQVGQWWGPRGFTLTTHSKDIKTGGHWNYTMHGPDGKDWENRTKYLEVEKYKKLVYDHGANETQEPLFRVTVFFSEVQGKTHMDMTMAFKSPEVAKEMSKFIKSAGGDGTWDRLAEHIEKKQTGVDRFVINRTFETDLETMFEMWTNPKHFSQWLPPTGMQMEFLKADIRPGGRTLYVMTGNDIKMFGRAEYLAIEKPGKLVYTQQFCDEDGNLSRHPHAPTWPATMLTTVQLTAEGPQKTRVTITWECHGDTTKEELETFIGAKPGMSQGWGGSFDKLEAYLKMK